MDVENVLDNATAYKTAETISAEICSKSSFDSICILHVNIVSLNKNFDNQKVFLSRFSKADVLCFSETRLNNRNLVYCQLPGYKLYHYNSKTKAGGSAMLVADCLSSQQLQIRINSKDCEDVWVKINLSEFKTLTVGSVYRHPTTDIKYFENAYINVIKSFKANKNYVFLGDFNVNYDELSSIQAIKQYKNHISSVGCTQLINQPTRITQTSSTVIDHIYVNSASVSHVIPTIVSEDISDYLPIFAEFICKQSKKSAKRAHSRKY